MKDKNTFFSVVIKTLFLIVFLAGFYGLIKFWFFC